MKGRRISLAAKNAWTGRLFILPLYLGFFFFLLVPITQSIFFIFNNLEINPGGYTTSFAGMYYIDYIFTVDPVYNRWLIESVVNLLWHVPVILLASLFIAVILKSKFIGRTFVRGVFFLPVIIASGIIIDIIRFDTVANSVLSGNVVSAGTIFKSTSLMDMLIQAGLNQRIVSIVTDFYNNMFDLLWRTGIQTIIFLAALQSIPSTLYEASSMEGATAWENFWKITVPMISPMIFLNMVYTIIDYFTNPGNLIMGKVMADTQVNKVSFAAAMSWIYFIVIAAILGLVTFVYYGIGRLNSKKGV